MSQSQTRAQPKIESHSFGRIVIDGRTYTSDVIVHPGGVEDHWLRRSGHELVREDLEGVVQQEVHTLIVGTGRAGLMRVPEKTRQYLESAGLQVIVERTDKACETYNHLSQRGGVIAALHLSC